MAIYLSRKKGGTVATPITPSNSNPAQMTANTPVNPTANGYAIENYLDVYPDNDDPVQISSDVVAVFKGAGVAIEDAPITAIPNDNNPPELDEDRIYIIRNNTGYLYETQPATPTSLTPSNSSPATITSGETYTATDNGKAIVSLSEYTITSGATKILIYPNNPVVLRNAVSGYIVGSANDTAPSDTNPPLIPTTGYYKPLSAGYLYASSGLGKCKAGSVSLTANTNNSISCGFKPKYIAYSIGTTGNVSVYNQDVSTTQYKKCSSSGIANTNIGTSASYNLISIDSSGFTVRGASSAATMYYFAIG